MDLGVVSSETLVGEKTCTAGVPLSTVVDDEPAVASAEGNSLSLATGTSSVGTFPLLFVLNHSMTFLALLVEAALPNPIPKLVLDEPANLAAGKGDITDFGGTTIDSEGATFSFWASRVASVFPFAFCLNGRLKGSTMTVKVFLLPFDEVVLALDEVTGLNKEGVFVLVPDIVVDCGGGTCEVEGRLAEPLLEFASESEGIRKEPFVVAPFT